jgi:phytoene dehydrogenase-like protein
VSRADAVVIGAGHNALAAALILAKDGWKVTVLERAEQPGGAVRTAEVTLPGFRHDLYATNLNIFMGGAFFDRFKDDLFGHGFGVAGTPHAFASVFPDDSWAGVSADSDELLASIAAHSQADAAAWGELGGFFGEVAPALFAVLGSPMPSPTTAKALWPHRDVLRRRWRELLRLAVLSPRELVEERFESPEVQTLVGSWGMHMDFGPDTPGGGVYALIETYAAAAHGMALGAGGAGCLIDALVSLIEEQGGEVVCGAEAERIHVTDGRATAVTTTDRRRFEASRAVIASTGPRALYDRLLNGQAVPSEVARGARSYSYGPGTMMVHLAVDGLPAWTAGPQLRRYSYVHIAPYLGDLGIAYAQAMAGLLPEHPMIVVGQPTAVDPSRAPEGKHVLWLQVRAVPGTIRGDAAGIIATRDWAEAKEAYADRVLEIVERYAPGLSNAILGRHVISPADLQAANPNLVGGDHLGGSLHPSQNFLFRPMAGWSNHRTPVKSLYMCGAATWPGPGVGAGSGWLVGRQLTRPARVTSRLRRKV